MTIVHNNSDPLIELLNPIKAAKNHLTIRNFILSEMNASRYEREFCEYSETKGFHAERVAGSGRRKKSVCDVVLIKNGQGYLVEVKSTRDKVYYVSDKPNTKENLEELIKVAKKSGGVPLLAVRFKTKGRRKTWVVKVLSSELGKVPRTDATLF